MNTTLSGGRGRVLNQTASNSSCLDEGIARKKLRFESELD